MSEIRKKRSRICLTDRGLQLRAARHADHILENLQDESSSESEDSITGTEDLCDNSAPIAPENLAVDDIDYIDTDHDDENSNAISDINDTLFHQQFSSSSEENSDDSDVENDEDFMNELRKWVLESNIPLVHTNTLLALLRPHFPYLPKDARTLLHTRRSYNIEQVAGGDYHHFGIQSSIKIRLEQNVALCDHDTLFLQINVDGLPLFKSSSESFWPILGLLPQEKSDPFVIGLWVGKSKPSDANMFLQKFVDEMKNIEENGISFNDKDFNVAISNFVCDTPARCFVKRTKGHGGYEGCDYCEQRGVYFQHRMTFPETDAPPRTDVRFHEMVYDEHQHGESVLSSLKIGMVTQFPLDYMHLICLGMMKKLIWLWMNGPKIGRLGPMIQVISTGILALKMWLPREFVRKGRSLSEVDRWKATEFRTFLLYTGPVVLKGKLSTAMYKHFMLLFVAIYILCSDALCTDYSQFAGRLLTQFVEEMSEAYGAQTLIYNAHCLTHLATHSQLYGNLHNFSSFPFENYLQTLKKLVRKPKFPLPQVGRRLTEKMHLKKRPNNSSTFCKKEYQRGPVPTNMHGIAYTQYTEIHMPKYVLSISQPDNAILVGDETYLIKNIIEYDNTRHLVCKAFSRRGLLFDYPVDSSRLGIWSVSCESHHFTTIDPARITAKIVLLPYSDKFISIPLL